MQKLIFLIVFLSINFTLFAQNRKILTPNGKLQSFNEVKEVKQFNKFDPQTKKINPVNSINGIIDTLSYNNGAFSSNITVSGQEWLLQWFEAPTDLIIKKLGFYCTFNPDDLPSEVKIVKVNWPHDELLSAGTTWWGYYEALGNGYNDFTAFLDNPDRTGGWTSIQPGVTEPFGEDIWSDNGVGYSFIPDESLGDYQWIETNSLGFEPAVLTGEIFGIALKNPYPIMGEGTMRFLAGITGVPGWKVYINGRLDPGVDFGWWTVEYTVDFAAEVDLIGNLPPQINSFTIIPSGIDTGPFTINANITDFPDPFFSGIDSAYIQWSNDGGTTWNNVTMTGIEPDYTGEIPEQSPNTSVDYRIVATDVTSNTTYSYVVSFFILGPSGANTLVVFNGYSSVTGYPQDYYFGSGDWPNSYETLTFDHDVWAYGALSAVVLDNYTNIIEITTGGPNDINNDNIRAWLEGDPNRNYLLAGDEWLGAQSGWVNGPHSAGEFIFDVLGINYEYNDVNYGVGGDELLPSVVYPQIGSLLGGPIYDLYTQVSSDSGWTAPMTYDPYYEIGASNWIDGVDFEANVEVDLKGLGADGNTYNVAGHRTLPAGNKIAFFGYDPLSLNSDGGGPEYWWYGFMDTAPQGEVLKWFGIPVGIEQPVSDLIPDKFSLSQNYPNPFNPSTTINWQLAIGSRATIKVYDILGNEVATLVDKELPAGKYEIEFNATGLPSGVYFYQLKAGEFIQTKKMLLLK